MHTPTDTAPRPRWAARLRALANAPVVYPLLGLAVVCIAMSLASAEFLTTTNLLNILRQVSVIGIIAIGMSLVILSGGIDLSVGAVAALVGTLSAGLMVNSGLPPAAALLAGLAAGAVVGVFNGTLVAYTAMPPIIVTLAVMGMARGLGLIYSGGYPISGVPSWVGVLGGGVVGGVPVPVLLMLGLYLLAWVLLEHTPFGRYVYAIGGNERAARLSGIPVARVKLTVYALCGITAAIAAIVLMSRLRSGQPSTGAGFELDAIAAVVLGGTAITGGRGSIVGTLIGVTLLGVLNNGLNLMRVDPYIQDVLKGGIILAATYVGRERRASA